jgi:hypothetical protein
MMPHCRLHGGRISSSDFPQDFNDAHQLMARPRGNAA